MNADTQVIASRTALVLETNNLRGGDQEQIIKSIERLMGLLKQQTLAPGALAQWILTHDGLPKSAQRRISELAGRPMDFVEISGDTGYYDAKNAGFAQVDAARCDYVVFGDADCVPHQHWLQALLAPFARPDAPDAVAGRTSYAPGVLGVALTAIDFMYFPSPLRAHATRNFYANNVAFRHAAFKRYHYQPMPGIYRAHCQALGLRLQAEKIAVHYAPDAHTTHRLPDTWRDVLQLRWMRGEDTVGLTPVLVRSYLPNALQWFAHTGPIAPLCVLMARLFFSFKMINRQGLPVLRGWRRASATVAMLGVSLLDMSGALFRGLGLGKRHAARRGVTALSYHGR